MARLNKHQLTTAQLNGEVILDKENSVTAMHRHGVWQYCWIQRGWVVAVRCTNGDEREVSRLLEMSDEQYMGEMAEC